MSDANDSLESAEDLGFATQLGERLRQIRKQKRLALTDVEAQSRHEFKASVMGAYERGERMISVQRLERLAKFYGVTVDQLLPRDPLQVETLKVSGAPIKLRIDVAKLSLREGDDFKMLERLLRMIQVQRQDFNGKVITVRENDVRAIAVILNVPVDEVATRLSELDLVFVPPTA
jgi:transcriptional regulator with XRE-family HTH domain